MTNTNTIEPVTLSGWYEHTDGTVGYYHWHQGFARCTLVVSGWTEVGEIKDAERALDSSRDFPWIEK